MSEQSLKASDAGAPIPKESLIEQAAAWKIRLHEEGLSSSPEFESWRAADPAHETAWAQVERPWDYLEAQAVSPELIAVRGAALERARRAGELRWRSRRISSSSLRPWAAVAAALLVVLAGALFYSQRQVIYRTAVGERRMIPLEDGSSVSLDSHSALAVHYTRSTRALTLLQGQGRFDVAHEASRPFRVTAGDRTVIATGTSFDVDLVGHDVVVTLIEGHVTVLEQGGGSRASDAQAVHLNPGERLIAQRSEPATVKAVNPDRARAWQSGQLVFDDETLASAVERINRYSRTQVTVSPSAADLRFSGVFHEGDTQAFIEAVSGYLSLTETPESDGTVRLERR